MNKFSIYILLIIIYLGLSKSFAPSEQKSPFVANQMVLASVFNTAPLAIILTDSFQAGFLIKTYFMQLKLVYGFRPPEEVVIRTSPEYWKSNLKNLGMTIFMREERDAKSSFTPMPPGALFIGDPAFGHWDWDTTGGRIWQFYRAYDHFPEIFGWGDFKPDFNFYKKMQLHLEHNTPFYGTKNEFGREGFLTKQIYGEKPTSRQHHAVSFGNHIKKFFKIPHGRDHLHKAP